MTRKAAYAVLNDLVADYLSALEADEIPNTRVALIDDFGQWLTKQRDDQPKGEK